MVTSSHVAQTKENVGINNVVQTLDFEPILSYACYL